jgi:hypothetical protein
MTACVRSASMRSSYAYCAFLAHTARTIISRHYTAIRSISQYLIISPHIQSLHCSPVWFFLGRIMRVHLLTSLSTAVQIELMHRGELCTLDAYLATHTADRLSSSASSSSSTSISLWSIGTSLLKSAARWTGFAFGRAAAPPTSLPPAGVPLVSTKFLNVTICTRTHLAHQTRTSQHIMLYEFVCI